MFSRREEICFAVVQLGQHMYFFCQIANDSFTLFEKAFEKRGCLCCCCFRVAPLLPRDAAAPENNSLHEKCALSLHVSSLQQQGGQRQGGSGGADPQSAGMDLSEVSFCHVSVLAGKRPYECESSISWLGSVDDY